MEKLLFLSHNASRTGAPLLLLELLRWWKTQGALKATLLLSSGGPLLAEFEALLPTTLVTGSRLEKLAARLQGSRRLHNVLAKDSLLEGVSVVYANTVACADMLPQVAGEGRRIIHHVHELKGATRKLGMLHKMRKNVHITNQYIAASEAVALFLRQEIEVPAAKVHVIHEFPIHKPSPLKNVITRDRIRAQLGLQADQILVLMSGTPEWRKGSDLFVRMAAMARSRVGGERLQFLWLGGNSKQLANYQKLASQLNVHSICRFVSSVERPQDWLTAADIFSLTSREEPFSVVMLEAALAGLPIICFAGSGGAPELVQDDAGFVIAPYELDAMAAACIQLAENEELRQRMGAIARNRVSRLYLIDRQAGAIHRLIQGQLNC